MNAVALIRNVGVGISPLGKTIFATHNIQAGYEIMHFSGKRMNFTQAKALGKNESYTLQIDNDTYLYLNSPEKYINHSCDPNCGLRGLTLIALRNIKAGEELFYDYSTTMLERSWTMQCKCGSPMCRKTVTDFDLIPQTFQQYYIDRQVVQPFILNKLRS